MPSTPSIPAGNRLLDGLPHKERQHFLTHCEQVVLEFAEILADPGDEIRYVYFPTQSFISMIARVAEHASMEVGLVGNEGMLGASLVLDVDISPLHALVQGAGPALRMAAGPFRHELQRSPALQQVLKRYLFVELGQLAQTAACNRFHVVEARLARWLLMTHDRAHNDAFHITHEFLAAMLGVRRVGVTKAASALQNHKLISYHRGEITILDRDGLEAASCSCYAADIATYAQMLASPSTQARPDAHSKKYCSIGSPPHRSTRPGSGA